MGNEYGDAQNIAVRVFLNQFSKKFNTFFDDEYKQKTLKYFNYQCPYSGEDISDGNFVMDHIVPFNRECCGLHVYGNILLVTKEANKNKHHHSLEKFLKNEPERLEKIKRFMEESGFAGFTKYTISNCV
jgi:5-methylcytosine-specific restriction endonuclease McrA